MNKLYSEIQKHVFKERSHSRRKPIEKGVYNVLLCIAFVDDADKCDDGKRDTNITRSTALSRLRKSNVNKQYGS